jgi:predicted HicB family RNase H-like nuclease
MKYKGYTGLVELEEGSDVLFGRVIGLRDVVTFQGESVAEVTQAFHDSVDDYLEFCATRGESPEKPYSGQFVLQLDPALHRELATIANMQSVTLNAFIDDALRNVVLQTSFQMSVQRRGGGPRKQGEKKKSTG